MSKGFKTAIDLEKNELQNAVIQNLSSAPGSPVKGLKYFNSTTNIEYYYNGSAWVPCSYSLTINNNGNDRVLTSNNSVSSIEAEANLLFDGTNLKVGSIITIGDGKIGLNINGEDPSAHLDMCGIIWMSGSSTIDLATTRGSTTRKWRIQRATADERFHISHVDAQQAYLECIGIDYTSRAIRFNNAYTFPVAIGSVGQVLKVPGSGSTLEWGAAGGMASHGNEYHSSTFLTGNQQITLTGDATGSGGTSIAVTVGKVTLTKTPADHAGSGTVVEMTAGTGGMAIGDVGFINSAGKVQRGKADDISTSGVTYLCLESSLAADASGLFLRRGIFRDDTWNWTIGQPIYLSTTGTAGNTLTQTAPSGSLEVVQVLAVALTADVIDFDPNIAMVTLIE